MFWVQLRSILLLLPSGKRGSIGHKFSEYLQSNLAHAGTEREWRGQLPVEQGSDLAPLINERVDLAEVIVGSPQRELGKFVKPLGKFTLGWNSEGSGGGNGEEAVASLLGYWK